MSRSLFLTIVCLLIGLDASAHAAASVVIVPFASLGDIAPDTLSNIQHAIADALDEHRLSGAPAAVTIAVDTWKPSARSGSSALDQINEQIRVHKYEPALRALRKVIARLEKHLDSSDSEDPARAYLLYSVANFQTGHDDDGQKALDEFVRLRPDAEMTTDSYPPLFLRLAQKARDKQAEQSRATLVIAGQDPDLEIRLDGRALGSPPLMMTRITNGRHRLLLSKNGKQAVRLLNVTSHHLIVHVDDSAALAGNRFDQATAWVLADAARNSHASAALSAAVSQSGEQLVVRVVFARADGSGVALPVFALDSALAALTVEAGKVGDLVARSLDGMDLVEAVPLIEHHAFAAITRFDFFTGTGGRTAKPVAAGDVTSEQTAVIAPVTPVEKAAAEKPVAKTAPEPVTTADTTPVETGPLRVLPGVVRPLAHTTSPTGDIATAPKILTVAPGLKPGPASDQPVAETSSSPLYTRWWLWTAVGTGAVVVGGVIAAIVVSTAKVSQVSVDAHWQ